MFSFLARIFGASAPEQSDLFPASTPAPLSPEARRVLDEQLEQVQPVDLGEFDQEAVIYEAALSRARELVSENSPEFEPLLNRLMEEGGL